MGSAALFHLRHEGPLVDAPPPTTQISATGTPTAGIWTVRLLDPAAPAIGATQGVETISPTGLTTGTYHLVHGRWLTRPLAAQTIGAGNWTVYAAERIVDGAEIWTNTLWGYCIAQWRPGTGVIARAVDLPNGGTGVATTGVSVDRVAATTQAGASLTLLAGDCLALELWSQIAYVSGSGAQVNHSLLYGGVGEYVSDAYAYQALTDTAAIMEAPQAVVFQ